MCESDAAGEIVSANLLESHPSEVLGNFVVLPDGILTLWMPIKPGYVLHDHDAHRTTRWLPTKRRPAAGSLPRHARLACYDRRGWTRWSTTLALRDLAFPGLVMIGRDTGPEPVPVPPWTPWTLAPGSPTSLLVSGSRIAATVACESSGIAVTFFVDTETGRLVGSTRPGPSRLQAIAGPGEFLLGTQGYGAFETCRYDATGAVIQHWPTHAQMLIDTDSVVSGPESQNTSRAQYFVRFGTDGWVQRGPRLKGYDTAYPALDRNGTAVFWRNSRLRAVDADLTTRVLYRPPKLRDSGTSRVLLLGQGHIVVPSHNELLIFREPRMSALNDGIWPCGDGGLHGNPVKFVSPADGR